MIQLRWLVRQFDSWDEVNRVLQMRQRITKTTFAPYPASVNSLGYPSEIEEWTEWTTVPEVFT